MLKLIYKKLNSTLAESLAELLISVLILTLGLMMFATAIMSSEKMMNAGEKQMQSYYEGRNILDLKENGHTASVIIRENGSKRDLAATVSSSPYGTYPISLFSGETNFSDTYRYERLERVGE